MEAVQCNSCSGTLLRLDGLLKHSQARWFWGSHFSSLVLADKSRRHLTASWKPRLVCPGEGAAPMQDDLVLQKEEMDTSECLVLTV